MIKKSIVGLALTTGLCFGITPITFAATTSPSSTVNQGSYISVSTSDDLENAVIQALSNRTTTLKIDYKQKANITAIRNTIVSATKTLDDYSYYTFGGYEISYTDPNKNEELLTITFKYRETNDQTAFVDNQVQQIISQIITPDMTDDQKEKAIHDYIDTNIAYDYTLKNYTAYSALTTRKTVCEGYALLAYKLFNAAGLDSRIITGSSRGEAHAWNLVKINGSWYHVDTTWDREKDGSIIYDYYNLTDAQIIKTHKINKSETNISLPVVTKVDYKTELLSCIQNNPNETSYQDLYNNLFVNPPIPASIIKTLGQPTDSITGITQLEQSLLTAMPSQPSLVVKYTGSTSDFQHAITAIKKQIPSNIKNISWKYVSFNNQYIVKFTFVKR